MAGAKTPLKADEKASATCGWKDCNEEAVSELALDRGSKVCEACGTEITERAVFKLCEEHNDQYTESGDVTLLLLSAKEA